MKRALSVPGAAGRKKQPVLKEVFVLPYSDFSLASAGRKLIMFDLFLGKEERLLTRFLFGSCSYRRNEILLRPQAAGRRKEKLFLGQSEH